MTGSPEDPQGRGRDSTSAAEAAGPGEPPSPGTASPEDAAGGTASDPNPEEAGSAKKGKARDPARTVTLVVLGLCGLFFVLYIWADRVMPYSDQSRVKGYAVSIVPQVSGYVTDIEVALHEVVDLGQLLVRIDTTQYQIAVRSARAALDNAIQQLGAADAGVESAVAGLASARAQESIARLEFQRISRISERNPNALSQADRDRAESALRQAEAQVASAEAEVRRAQAQLGVEGDENPAIRSALAALEQAEFNLARTVIRAPARGAIESLELDVGHFAGAGQPLMAFVSTSDVWIQADMRENNLAHLGAGDPVEILLDAAPGEVFHGTVRSIGFGVSQGGPSSKGDLPQVSQTTGWLRQPQRFPVIVDLGQEVPTEVLRVGAQASVMAFTRERSVLNPLGRLMMRFLSLMSYVR